MALSDELLSQFAKITKPEETSSRESTVYGTTVIYEGKKYVKLDGSDLLTPISATTNIEDGERVTVQIKDHTATVTGNLTTPSASTADVDRIGTQISEFEIIIAGKVDAVELNAERARIDELVADNVVIKDTLTAVNADITNLEADNATIKGRLDANEADITNLEAENVTITGKLDAVDADIDSLQADNVIIRNELEANKADILELEADNVVINNSLTAANASIKNLEATKLSAIDIEGKYANIDFSNIGQAAIEKFFSESGMIKDLIVSNGTISGELIGVTIKGDLIEGNTIVADKLVVLGEDGLYYKLNTNGVTTEAEQTDYNSLNGKIITAKSITAEKIVVDDLVAFGATIGGFHITDDAIYSGVKESVHNTTKGTYLDNKGQFAIGDGSNYIKYYTDEEGYNRLEISAASMKLGGSSKTVQEELDEIREEVTCNLRIESSRGTVFKNNNVSTVLSAVIYRGSQRITNMTDLKAAMGNSVYLQWKWQRLDDSSFGVISASDTRLSNDGFTFSISPADVDTKVTFMCELIV